MIRILFILLPLILNIFQLHAMETGYNEAEQVLIEKPNLLLDQNDQTKGYFLQNIDWQKAIQSADTLKSLVEKYKAKSETSPLFLISECTDNRCPLNRATYPLFRFTFENKMAEATSTLLASGKTISFVDFAAGDLFGLTRILTKSINKQPKGSMLIHLIDLEYQPFLNYHGGSAQIPESPQLNFPIESKEKVEAIEKIITTALRFDQFKNFFKKVAPNAHFQVFAHSTINDYFNYLQTNSQKDADIIVTSDIDDIPSVNKKSVFQHQELIARTFEKNPALQNYGLFKTQPDLNKPGAAIGSYSLTISPNAPKNEIKIGQKKINLYYNSTDIID